jgi:pimeloyl-ACP methyl ester carboxylesterase
MWTTSAASGAGCETAPGLDSAKLKGKPDPRHASELVNHTHWPARACETPAGATFVLIPGAGTDPRVYDATIEALGALGHGGLAPALPLDDPDATPSDHADAVVRALPADAELVVVGQSLGAFAAPLVAARAPVTQLVLVAPMIPRPGETAGEWWASTGHEEAIADLLKRHGPMSSWGTEAIAEVFLHDVDPAVARDNERYQGAPGDGMFGEPWPLESWPDVPTRVLVPLEDRLFPLEFQRRVAGERLGLEVDEIPGGHLPMLSRPGELAERLIELAESGHGVG